MDVYQLITDYVLNFPVIKEWTEAGPLFEHAASMQPRDWRLPIVACQAVGGSIEQAIPASAALACAQIGVILIDDMLDDDPRGEYHRIGEAQAANFAAAFMSAGSEAILQSHAPSETKLAAVKSLSRMILTTAFGQYLDCQNPADEEAYWLIVRSKSAPFFGSAFHLGALLGGAPSDMAENVERIGRLYGEMIQIHDDLNDTMAVPANPDWTLGRSPLPILFARLVDHPEHQRFLDLHRDVSDPDALREAQNILIQCGAVSYCVDQLLSRHRAAQDLLSGTPLIRREVIEPVLHELVAPVYRLFEALGNPLKDETIFSAPSEAPE
jgi:geranylgeranyl pyrophosphate synthase